MISTFSGLNTMVNGIHTNRLALNTVGHNISNSGTEGYSRQSATSAAAPSSTVYTLAGNTQVGNGSTIISVMRARDIYADHQFWKETCNQGYYEYKASNYAKIESIFNDSDNSGIQNSMELFFKAWEDCSTQASSDTSRQNVINAGQNFAESLLIAATQVKEQMASVYDDISLNLENINVLTSQMVELNQNIAMIEASGAHANDLRDQRDLIVDKLSNLMNITVAESSNGMYTLVSNGTTLVNGIVKVDLDMSAPIENPAYGLNDYNIIIRQTGTKFKPGNGELEAQVQSIADNKGYIDQLANIGTFMFTTLNDQHKQGCGLDDAATTNLNFFGKDGAKYEWDAGTGLTEDGEVLRGIEILHALKVNSKLTDPDGHRYLGARGKTLVPGTLNTYVPNGTGDGSNAIWLAALFNCEQVDTSDSVNGGERVIGKGSLFSYYNTNMTTMGSDTSNMNSKVKYQEGVIQQVSNLRDSTAGVNWDEELSNMIMFQQGYSACSRCLTAMDECLDKLVNGTGVVGR